MGMFDFLKGKKEAKFAPKPEPLVDRSSAKKQDLGVCIPNHAKSAEERKRLSKREDSPFDKLRKDYEKEIKREARDIYDQKPSEPYDFEPELGVESIGGSSEKEASAQEEKKDELDEASEKMDTFVPKFSKTAREKVVAQREESGASRPHGEFEVSGVYPGGDTTIISGTVISGIVNKRMTAHKGTTTIRVSELKRGVSAAEELHSGDSGSIFVRGYIPSVRYGDILEFG